MIRTPSSAGLRWQVWTVYPDGLPSVSGSTSRGRMSATSAIATAHEVIDALLTQDGAAAD